jgi:hypothetical protein
MNRIVVIAVASLGSVKQAPALNQTSSSLLVALSATLSITLTTCLGLPGQSESGHFRLS